jgi:hypothetical protein
LLGTSLHLPDAIAQVTLPWCSATCDAHADCTAFSHQRRRALGVCKLHGPMAASAHPSRKASLQSSPDVWKLSVSPTWEVRDAKWVHSRRPEAVWRHAALDCERAAPSARETLARRSQVRTARPTLSACASSPTRCACMHAAASALGRAFLRARCDRRLSWATRLPRHPPPSRMHCRPNSQRQRRRLLPSVATTTRPHHRRRRFKVQQQCSLLRRPGSAWRRQFRSSYSALRQRRHGRHRRLPAATQIPLLRRERNSRMMPMPRRYHGTRAQAPRHAPSFPRGRARSACRLLRLPRRCWRRTRRRALRR